MSNLIYYPTFEPNDIDWIKYALIYVDKFSPIIPESGQSTLSDFFKSLQDKTDLIKVHEPKWQQGDNAATRALQEIDLIERHPEQYRDKLKSVNIVRTWTNPNNWQFKLYEEKFNHTFKYECIERQLGIECEGGLLTSQELAHLFMTFLAEEIAFEKKGNPITDIKYLDAFSTFVRTRNLQNTKPIEAAKSIVELTLPDKIEQIRIEKFFEFRNESGIVELRQSFNKTLDSYYSSIEDDFDPSEYIKTLQKTNLALVKELGIFFGGLTSATLGGLILTQSPNNLEMVKQVIEGTILSLTGIVSIKQSWAVDKEKRHARKFLTKIKEIG